MQIKQREVEQGLRNKGFIADETHHHQFVYWTSDGRKTSARTYTSHGGRELDSYLIGQMAKQCKLTREQFRNLFECRLSRADYEACLKEKNIIA